MRRIVVLCLIVACGSPPDTGEAVGAFVACQQFVNEQLESPATADYPVIFQEFTRPLGPGRFVVESYVDSENTFGALIRTNFRCEVSYEGEDRWSLISLEMG